MVRVMTLKRFGTAAAGFLAAIGLLALATEAGHAEKAKECTNHTTSLCEQVERCTPNGFEANGTCHWIYTIQRYYWGY
jgi:hypothetical protein